ncbi:MAG: SRPBCC family protein [Microbacterium sp.]
MTTDPFVRAITGDPEHATVTLRRRYRATPAQVWSAITTPERIARWFGTIAGTVPTRPGDGFHVDIGGGRVRRARVDGCDAPRALSYTWWSGDDEPGSVRIRLEAVGDGETELTVTHDRLSPTWAVGYGAGWEASLAALASALGGSEDHPDAEPTWELLRARPLALTAQFAASRARVWEAWTTVAGLSSWWWNHWDGVEVAADVRVGGAYRFAAPVQGMTVAGEYLVVDPRERLAFTWVWTDDEGSSSDEAVEVLFADVEDGTAVTVRHTGPWASEEPVESYRQGWEFVIGALRRTLG